MKIIKVLLVEDHMVVREGLRSLLEVGGAIEVIAQAQNGRQAVELARKFHPDVVLMDIAMPELNGFEATRQIMKAAPATRVVFLSAHQDDAYVDQAVALGAAGYLIKQSSASILSKAIREVGNGKTFFSPSISKRLEERSRSAPDRSGVQKQKNVVLSPRESETLQLIAEGKANKQIADKLHISIKTVEKHRQHLKEKLNIHDIAGLTRYAMASGIIEGCVQITP